MEQLQQLKSFEDACKLEGIDPEKIIGDFTFIPAKDRNSVISYLKLIIVSRAANRLANEGNEWTLDWNDEDQYKYQAWFYMGGSSGFQFHDCADWGSLSLVGSRLCFISGEVAQYVAKQFSDLFEPFMLIK